MCIRDRLKKGEQRLFIPVRIPDDGHGRAAVGHMADGVQRPRFIIIYRQLPASGVFAEKRGERAGDVAVSYTHLDVYKRQAGCHSPCQ